MKKPLQTQFVDFCRLKLGLKPVIDYAQSRRRLIGIADLPVRTVFDIGANVGKKSRLYRRIFPDAHLYCVEPLPECFRQLDRWARRQPGKVTPLNLALGRSPGETVIHYNTLVPGGSSLDRDRFAEPMRQSGHIVEVPVRIETLDNLASSLPIEDDIFVKIDVEGHDMEVIEGGRNLLARAAAVLVEIVLHKSRPCDQPYFGDFVNVLGELGFVYRGNLQSGFRNGVPLVVDAAFIKPPEARRAAA